MGQQHRNLGRLIRFEQVNARTVAQPIGAEEAFEVNPLQISLAEKIGQRRGQVGGEGDDTLSGAGSNEWMRTSCAIRWSFRALSLASSSACTSGMFSPTVALIYGAVTGLLWLSSVPPTSGLVAVMFGTRWLAMLFGIAFFSHQVGGFLGVYLGGAIYERTGSYDIVWWLGVMFGLLSAIINLPIVEQPVARLVANPA